MHGRNCDPPAVTVRRRCSFPHAQCRHQMQTAECSQGADEVLIGGADRRARGPSASLSYSLCKTSEATRYRSTWQRLRPHPSSFGAPEPAAAWRHSAYRHVGAEGVLLTGPAPESVSSSSQDPGGSAEPAADGLRRRYAGSHGQASSTASRQRTSTASSRCSCTLAASKGLRPAAKQKVTAHL